MGTLTKTAVQCPFKAFCIFLFISNANKPIFTCKSFALSLGFEMRFKASQKWLIMLLFLILLYSPWSLPLFQIEIKLVCHLTTRQRRLYQAVKNKISIDDLVYTSTSSSSTNATASSLMNLVMQFRKVISSYS